MGLRDIGCKEEQHCVRVDVRGDNSMCSHRNGWLSSGEDIGNALQPLHKYFPLIQRLQAWVHHVARYDGEDGETEIDIRARRDWHQLVGESYARMLSSWDDPFPSRCVPLMLRIYVDAARRSL